MIALRDGRKPDKVVDVLENHAAIQGRMSGNRRTVEKRRANGRVLIEGACGPEIAAHGFRTFRKSLPNRLRQDELDAFERCQSIDVAWIGKHVPHDDPRQLGKSFVYETFFRDRTAIKYLCRPLPRCAISILPARLVFSRRSRSARFQTRSRSDHCLA